MGQEKLFTIQNSSGRYVDRSSIWQHPETGEWRYISKGGYEFDNSMKNLDTGVCLYGSTEEAEGVVEWLKSNMYKVDNIHPILFTIKEVTY